MAGPAPGCLHGRTIREAIGFGALSHVAMTAQSGGESSDEKVEPGRWVGLSAFQGVFQCGKMLEGLRQTLVRDPACLANVAIGEVAAHLEFGHDL